MRWALAWALAIPPATAADTPLRLHVPSPDWRDQVMYFVLTDRFDDGDVRNNDQGAGEYRPGSAAHYQGGDFAGLQRRLDYIRGLGATALWITPPVANLWWDPQAGSSGYHGYWARHFAEVDAHLGTLADYQRLSDALHRRGMYLVQDIVVNHTGNFFGYPGGWNARQPAWGWQANTGALPTARPTQAPFDRNDPRDATQRRDGIYHWTPDVRDYTRRSQVLDWQMSGLDDLNTGNAAVRRALRASYGHWIREAGVDAYRVDTAFYVPPAFFDDFLHAADPAAPGIDRVARQTGRQSFFSFGEGFAIDPPGRSAGTRLIERYATRPDGAPRLPGMLNFPLYGSLGAVFARGAPTAELAQRIQAMMRLHRQPHLLPSFVDNHDVDRFLAGGSEAGLKQALLALMTLPGIPVLYYGTEQGFTEPRASMFAAGEGSGGRDRFDTDAPLYRWLQRATALRHAQPALRRGQPVLLRSSEAGPGVLAWRMDHGTQRLLVAFNTAAQPALMDGLPVGALPGATLAGLFAIDGDTAPLRADAHGRVNAVLPPLSGQVWALPAGPAAAPANAKAPASTPAPVLDAPVLDAVNDRLLARGRARPGQALQLVLDDDLAQAVPVTAGPDGRWQATLDTGAMIDPRARHRLVAWDAASGQASAPRLLRVPRPWTLLAEHADPAGDDHGRDGATRYPTDPGWGAHRQMDLRGLRVWRAGGALKIELALHRLTRSWNPANGFDHVAFTLFLGRAGATDGRTEMPLQDGTLPGGMRWQLRLRAHGWSNALFSADGASATQEGKPVTPGALLDTDARRHTVTFTLPASALRTLRGHAPTSDATATDPLSGLQLYVNTWDWDGGYRERTPEPGSHTPGGAPGPKLMDEIGPVTLR
ncbi:alpha-amylase family glycosyl hydrolase [Ideonella sp. DXS22W]|uniref:Alpha-amylase family glycosyl hydrolase n=1 Tax=Pseudaquabacterium inlustre TaxID=2984192 RepID=A0ABU9CCI5_9BURK